MSILTEKEHLVSTKELSKRLAISEATIKNWIKLNKIQPDILIDNVAFFTEKYSNNLVQTLKSEDSNLLKSRRNKNYITGNFFYKDYISSSSKNIDIITELLTTIEQNNIKLFQNEIQYLIADCAIQLLLQAKAITTHNQKYYLKAYLEQNLELGIFSKLIDDLIDDKNKTLQFITTYPKLFKNYLYERYEDILGLLYISLANLNNRKANGAYYTPTKIVKKIIEQIDFNNFSNKTIIDPCCGAGNFLLQLPNTIKLEQIYGNDIDSIAVNITRLNMALKFDIQHTDILYRNFTNTDFLLENTKVEFDYIIGNPPWGANFDTETYNKLKNKYLTAQNKNIESYDVFIEKSLSSLKTNGNLLFVLPESILTVKNHQKIRELILKNNSIKYLEILGDMFSKVQCPSIILHICHTNKPFSCTGLKVTDKFRTYTIIRNREVSSDAFNFTMDDEEYDLYKKLSTPNNKIYLKNNATFALGIVTGNNNKYITKTKTNTNEIILKGSDLDKYKIQKATNYIEFKPNEFQQVAPTEYYRTSEKLFYKFISKKLVFAYDNKQTLSLNSCNILIPRIDNLNIKYIMAILNSNVAQFLFEKKYNSVKVLRAHIEDIPIPLCDNNTQTEIINIVEQILNSKEANKNLIEELNEKTYDLFNLNEKEKNIIRRY